MKKFLVGIGIFFVVLWVINFNIDRSKQQIELAADIFCATFKAMDKYGATAEEIKAKNTDVRQAAQDTVLPIMQKYKLSKAAFRNEYAKVKERYKNDPSFKYKVACLMQKKGCKIPESINKYLDNF